jgi:hypothetical protein
LPKGFAGLQSFERPLSRKLPVVDEWLLLAYSVEKLSERDRRKNPTALESLKSPRAEGTAAFDDLRAQIRSVRHTSHFPRLFGRISIQLKNCFDLGKELSGGPMDRSAGAPTDPDVQDSRIRLFESKGC